MLPELRSLFISLKVKLIRFMFFLDLSFGREESVKSYRLS